MIRLIAIAAVISNLITGVVVYRYVHNAWDAEKAQATAAALAAKAKIDHDNADAAAKQAEEARDRDAEHAKTVAAIESDARDAAGRYAERLRILAHEVGSCRATSEALGAIVAEDGARDRNTRLSEGIGRDLAQIGKSANELAALVRDVCVPFANEVGR